MILRDVQHPSTKETPQILELTVEAVKTRLNRARLMMRDALARGSPAFSLRGEDRLARPYSLGFSQKFWGEPTNASFGPVIEDSFG